MAAAKVSQPSLTEAKAFLTRKVGPLPVWAWLAVAGVALYVWRKRQGAALTEVYQEDPYSYDSDYDTGSYIPGPPPTYDLPGLPGSPDVPSDVPVDVEPPPGEDGGGGGGGGKGKHKCRRGYSWDAQKKKCVKNKVSGGGHGCPKGWTYDKRRGNCVPIKTEPNAPVPTQPPAHSGGKGGKGHGKNPQVVTVDHLPPKNGGKPRDHGTPYLPNVNHPGPMGPRRVVADGAAARSRTVLPAKLPHRTRQRSGIIR